MLIVIVIQVAGRIAGESVPWSEELTRYLFLWTVNFGMAVGMRNAEHASVNVIYYLLPKTRIIQKTLLFIYVISCFAFFVLLTYWNLTMTVRQFNSEEMSPALGMPMFLVTLPLFICNILATVGLVQSAFFDEQTKKRLTMPDQGESFDQLEGGAV
jgi:TRAP-type C4-dicarboxylate transport system permease small subunit